MDGQILDAVTEWDTVPVSDGAEGLADLVGREFTGAVTDGVAWLFLLNGRGVGVADGTVDGFRDADLTAREAPDDSLPLLYAMMTGGAETRAKYYTEETALSAAHETLSDGGFTGFVELSENVLSGDYYVVYYGGRSLPVAFVGSSRTLLTGDEAFERADDEVGIYRVREADIEILDLPAPQDGDDAAFAAGPNEEADTAGVGTDDGAADTDAADETTAIGASEGADASTRDEPSFDATAALGGDGTDDTAETLPSEVDRVDEDADESVSTADSTPDTGIEDDAPTESVSSEETPSESDVATGGRAETDVDAVDGTGDGDGSHRGGDDGGDGDAPDGEAAERTEPGKSPSKPTEQEAASTPTASETDDVDETDESNEVTFGGARGATQDDERVFEEEAEWRETQVIPPLSPDDEARSRSATGQASSQRDERPESGGTGNADGADDGTNQALEELRERLRRAEAARDEAEERAAAIETERDELEAERDELRTETRRLRERIEELESAIERLEGDVEPEAESVTMAEEAALSGTSLFVRYGTKGEATLEKVHDGEAERDEVNENLRLEYHTTFESDPVAVDGRDFEAFLYDTVEYQFVTWLVEELIYELQSTRNTSTMQELYDVLPEIDRIEFRGNVSLRYDENGQENREQREFDVVCRDRMGNELVVAEIDDSREATGESRLTSLVEGTRRLSETSDTVAAAFAVTSSFFDPEALEVASEATKSGLLGRSKRKSYVKLSRKRGFHLCLVETRHGDFHVNVPEL